jgi:hypothetical protein
MPVRERQAPQTPAWQPGIYRAQRWVDVAWLTPRNAAGYSRVLPGWREPAPPKQAVQPAGAAARNEREAARQDLGRLRAERDAAGRPGQLRLAERDGWQGTALRVRGRQAPVS